MPVVYIWIHLNERKRENKRRKSRGIHLIYSAHIMFNDIAHCCSMFVNTNTENRWQWQYRFLSRLSFLYSLLGVSIFLLYIAALLVRLKINGESKNKRKKEKEKKSDLRFLNQNQFWCTIKTKLKFKLKNKSGCKKISLEFRMWALQQALLFLHHETTGLTSFALQRIPGSCGTQVRAKTFQSRFSHCCNSI